MTRYPVYHNSLEIGAFYLPEFVKVDKDQVFTLEVEEQTVVRKNSHQEKLLTLTGVSFKNRLAKPDEK